MAIVVADVAALSFSVPIGSAPLMLRHTLTRRRQRQESGIFAVFPAAERCDCSTICKRPVQQQHVCRCVVVVVVLHNSWQAKLCELTAGELPELRIQVWSSSRWDEAPASLLLFY